MNKKNVIIIGCNHTNTLGLIRSFGEAGIKPYAVLDCDPDRNMCRHSKWVERILYVKNYNNIDEVLNREFPDGGVIVTMSDESAEYLDRVYDKLSPNFLMPSFRGEGGHFKENISKETQRIQAEKVGILTPPTWTVKWDGDANTIPVDIIYPCIIKAIDSEEGPKDLNIFHNKEELQVGLDKLATLCSSSNIQIQTFLKKDKEIVFIGYANGKGHIEIPCMIEKGEEYPEGFGWFLFGVLSAPDETMITVNKLKELIAAFDYSGLFSIDFICKDGKAYICEINFRNDGNGYYPTAVGINLPYLWYKAITKTGVIQEIRPLKKKYSILREPITIQWAKDKKKWGKVFSKFLSADLKEVWNRKDPKPFVKMALNFISS